MCLRGVAGCVPGHCEGSAGHLDTGRQVPETVQGGWSAQKLDCLWPGAGLVIARYRKIPGWPKLSGDLGLRFQLLRKARYGNPGTPQHGAISQVALSYA